MRRWAWRGTLAVMAVLVLFGGVTTVKAFTLACDGSLEGLRYLRNVRSQIAAATAPPPTPRPSTPTSPPTPTVPSTPTPTLLPPTVTPIRTVPAAGATAPATPTATLTPTYTPTSTPMSTPTPTPPPAPAPPAAYIWLREVSGKIAVTAITTFVRVKEADAVAYPGHVVAAYVLDGAGCGEDAVRIQWLKAGLHAVREGQPEQVASALAARTTDPDDRTQLGQIVQIWAERQPWSLPMRRVQAAFEARST